MSIGTIVLNIALNLILVDAVGYQGLAMGNAIAALSNAGILLFLLRIRLGGLEDRLVLDSLARIAIATGIMGAAVWATARRFETLWPEPGLMEQLVAVSSEIGIGLATLALAARLLRLREFEQAMAQLGRRFRRRPIRA